LNQKKGEGVRDGAPRTVHGHLGNAVGGGKRSGKKKRKEVGCYEPACRRMVF